MPSGTGARTRERLRPLAEGLLNFIEQACLLTAVARRKMEGLDAPRARSTRNFSGGRGRQMRPLGRQRCVIARKRGLDEQEIGVAHKIDDGFAIGGRIGDIGHVADLLPRRDRHSGPNLAEAHRLPVIDPHALVVRPSRNDGTFEIAQPGPDGQPQFLQAIFQTLAWAASSIANARHGVPCSSIAVDT